MKGNEKEFEGDDIEGWSIGDKGVVVMMKVKMVVMERKV